MGQGWGGIEHEGTSFTASPDWKMGFGQAGGNFSGSQRQSQASSSSSFGIAQWVLPGMGALPSARPRYPLPQQKAARSPDEGCSPRRRDTLSLSLRVAGFWYLCIVFPCWCLMGILVAQIENVAYSSSVSRALRWRGVKGEVPWAHCTNLVLGSNLEDEE